MAGKGGDDAWKQKYDDLEDSLQTFRHQATKIKESLAKEVFHFSKFSCPNVWVMGLWAPLRVGGQRLKSSFGRFMKYSLLLNDRK